MAIFNSYVSLPEDNHHVPEKKCCQTRLGFDNSRLNGDDS